MTSEWRHVPPIWTNNKGLQETLPRAQFLSYDELSYTGCPKKMYHICFAHSFHTFLRNLLKHTSKDSQIHGDLLTPPPDSVTCPWRSRCHVLEVGVPEKCITFKSGISQKLCTWYAWFWCHPIAHFIISFVAERFKIHSLWPRRSRGFKLWILKREYTKRFSVQLR